MGIVTHGLAQIEFETYASQFDRRFDKLIDRIIEDLVNNGIPFADKVTMRSVALSQKARKEKDYLNTLHRARYEANRIRG
jgi:hypothetical protein